MAASQLLRVADGLPCSRSQLFGYGHLPDQ
jgi:hypothetical protein